MRAARITACSAAVIGARPRDAGQGGAAQRISGSGRVDFGHRVSRDVDNLSARNGQHAVCTQGDEQPGLRLGYGVLDTAKKSYRFVRVHEEVFGLLEQRPYPGGCAIREPGVCTDGEAWPATFALGTTQRLNKIPLTLRRAQRGNMDHAGVAGGCRELGWGQARFSPPGRIE